MTNVLREVDRAIIPRGQYYQHNQQQENDQERVVQCICRGKMRTSHARQTTATNQGVTIPRRISPEDVSHDCTSAWATKPYVSLSCLFMQISTKSSYFARLATESWKMSSSNLYYMEHGGHTYSSYSSPEYARYYPCFGALTLVLIGKLSTESASRIDGESCCTIC